MKQSGGQISSATNCPFFRVYICGHSYRSNIPFKQVLKCTQFQRFTQQSNHKIKWHFKMYSINIISKSFHSVRVCSSLFCVFDRCDCELLACHTYNVFGDGLISDDNSPSNLSQCRLQYRLH